MRIVQASPRRAAQPLAVVSEVVSVRWILFLVALLILVLARPVRAQLLVSEDDPGEPIWAVDVVTNQATPVLNGFGAVAMAVDGNTNTLYFMTNTVTLYKWDLDAPLTPPTLVGTTTNGGQSLSLTGLAFDNANNKLYASRTLDSASGPEGFYEVNPNTAAATLKFAVTASQFDFAGFDYDAATGNFYANSDAAAARGVYRVDFTNNNVNFLAPYPATLDNPPDIDGLAVGGGKVYLVEDRAVQTGGRVFVFNLSTNAYEPALQTPWFFNEINSGATYIPNFSDFMAQIPEPAGATALMIVGFAALARRRAK